jgi:glycosyltransferase involved in cell wall biosynthesis
LFCCEGFIVDGVASYNLHMAASLKQAGHRVAILGRWLGPGGYQRRHEQTGVEVLGYFASTVVSDHALSMAKRFSPDVLISDARRAFPLALEIHKRLGTPIVTNIMDDPVGKDKPGRTMGEIHDNSVAWVSPEPRLVAMARALSPAVPLRVIRRAVLPELFPATPIPKRDPFRVLCLGRLSRFKFAGQRAVVKSARRLLETIPSLEITVVGGGWRKWVFMMDAARINVMARRGVVKIAGCRVDPSPWIVASTLVCGGSTCGLETLLSNRPLVAVSGFWFGSVTPENLEEAVRCYYAERDGRFLIQEKPEIILEEIENIYETWDDEKIAARTRVLRERMLPKFSPALAAQDWSELFDEVL